MDAFLMFSGQVADNSLFEIGKGLVSSYYFNTGQISSGQILSGYDVSATYKTGVTGQIANITGYQQVRSGVLPFLFNVSSTGSLSVSEGDRYYKSFGDYFESQGFLFEEYQHSYNPTGESAHATLGLQTGVTGISGYSYSITFPSYDVNMPLYEIVDLTGYTTEVLSITNTPVYTTVYETGADVSGIYLTGQTTAFQKDFIYYLGQR
jgi:hypothetical protein